MAGSDSDGSTLDASSLIHRFQRKSTTKTANAKQGTSPPQTEPLRKPSPGLLIRSRSSFESHETVEETPLELVEAQEDHIEWAGQALDLIVDASGPEFDRDSYRRLTGWDTVAKVLGELRGEGEPSYRVRYGDNGNGQMPLSDLLRTKGGEDSLARFENGANSITEDSDLESMVSLRFRPKRVQNSDDLDIEVISSGEGEDDDIQPARRSSRKKQNKSPRLRLTFHDDDVSDLDSINEDDDDVGLRRSRRFKRTSQPVWRGSMRTRRTALIDDGESSDDQINLLDSDVIPRTRKRKANGRDTRPVKIAKVATRRSERVARADNNIEEINVDDVYRSDSEPPKLPPQPKVTLVKEIFHMLPANNVFRKRHMEVCETCGQAAQGSIPLINCQGCILAYHKNCLGTRTTRDHLVTKVGEDNFVLQCRRCVNTAQAKDHLAPNSGRCQVCHQIGVSCTPFSNRKTSLQAQKEREQNSGEDPIVPVDPKLVNNVDNVLFRCTHCWRAFHFQHLPNRDQYNIDSEEASELELAESRFNSYKRDWQCRECKDAPTEVGGLVAWRPVESEALEDSSILPYDMVDDDDKEYLIKWKDLSYAHSVYMPGAWVWGITAPAMRLVFARKQTGSKMRIEDAIPEEYLRIDVVLDVQWSNKIAFRTIEVDKARAKEVSLAYIKYKGLGYEDAVWEKPPSPDEGNRWVDFITAYNDWVAGQWLTLPKSGPMKTRLEKLRNEEFSKLEKKQQPEQVTGGEMMNYQLDGLNWIYYQWHQRKNGILADEMGLGKTIQIIAFLTMMVTEVNVNCSPFLVVVPNSTCPNWRREIKKWAPSLRVVTYYGTSIARDIAKTYELYPKLPEGKESKEIKAHVVVTSYEAAADQAATGFFKSIAWQGLIVDEGQRLKSDKTVLHKALKNMKVPFRLLMTGTPLQNNARELFNLLQFLDDSLNADELEREYEVMTDNSIRKLHDLIRPFILRRTKAQVLTFLPPMAQIILPVSMSTLQKKTYTSILAKNPDLLKALFSRKQGEQLAIKERASLSNILMQLRKCLCHPFVYSRDIEETRLHPTALHHNLVEASAKLKLLNVLLPKLREGGHRVLIFSQFLDMLDILEDFLDGLGMKFNRLDGSITSLEKQKRIDQFNQPNSELFAFLLSTRAGGVGINLATADTVIILDPDFNPHQDIQALSRAHRIGQTKKVLCFQIMTRSSAEEKIVQIGRKKMALDHVVVEQLDADDLEERDLEGILRHGATELFADGSEDQGIRYDDASVERLLDRTQIENTKTGGDDSAESQFSFARVWANNSGALEETLDTGPEKAPDPSVWDKILKERERAVAIEAATRQQVLGRGKRTRGIVDYNADGKLADNGDRIFDGPAAPDGQAPDTDINTPIKLRRHRSKHEDSDTDFQPDDDKEHSEDENENARLSPGEVAVAPGPKAAIGSLEPKAPTSLTAKQAAAATVAQAQKASPSKAVPAQNPVKPKDKVKSFRRANIQPARVPTATLPTRNFDGTTPRRIATVPPPIVLCQACGKHHHQGSCPLKVAGVEHCNLCGLAHYGVARTCPHIGSETQVIAMLEALKGSNEPLHLRELATKYLRGVKGSLAHQKRQVREKMVEVEYKEQQPGNVRNRIQQAWLNDPNGLSTAPVSGFGVLMQTSGNVNGIDDTAGQRDDIDDRVRAALTSGL